jgi:hypothetical protein
MPPVMDILCPTYDVTMKDPSRNVLLDLSQYALQLVTDIKSVESGLEYS